MKEKKTAGSWQFDFEWASSVAILRAESIEYAGQHDNLHQLDFLVISEHGKPYKLRFAFEANEGKSPIYSSKGWDVIFEMKFRATNFATLKVPAEFMFPVNERNKNIREVRELAPGKLKKALMKADYMEVSWEHGGSSVTAKFNPAGSKKAIKAIISKSRQAYVSNRLSSVWMGLRKSTAEKVINKYKRKYRDKETHFNGVMADDLREMVIKNGGLKGVRYWEFEDYSCIYDIEKGRRSYRGEKISPLWYDHRSHPYGTGERRPNIDGLPYYIPIADKDHRDAVAKSRNEDLAQTEAELAKNQVKLKRLIRVFKWRSRKDVGKIPKKLFWMTLRQLWSMLWKWLLGIAFGAVGLGRLWEWLQRIL